MIKLDNITTTIKIIQHDRQSTYDDNQEIIWPTVVGIFVALALGWMICRYKCSSEERSPHIIRCCPKSLCKRIRLCCICIFRFKNESQQHSSPDSRMPTNRRRLSNNSILEIPFIINNSTNKRSCFTHPSQQWPPSFLLNNNNQGPSFPLSITIQPTINSSQPKRHPLRRESILPETEHNNETRGSSPWPFQTTNMLQICLYHRNLNQSHRYRRQIINITEKTTCQEVLTDFISDSNTARLIETCFGFKREIALDDCLFDVITRNQAIEEFKIVVSRLNGM